MSAANGLRRTPAVWRRGHLSFLVRCRPLAVCTALVLLALALAAVALMTGRTALPLSQVVHALLGLGDGGSVERVVLDIRLPRVLTALFVGAALGVSGAIFQSVSRNALGSPDVIGFTTGAATGALAQIVLFGGGSLAVMLAATGGGILTAALVYLLSRRAGVVGSHRLVLVGIGVGAILAALNGLLLVKGDLDNATMANLWLAGSLNARHWGHALPVMLGSVLLVPLAALSARRLSLIEMGDDLARQLGVGVESTRLAMVFCAVVLAALATGAAGPIAFIALAAPPLAARLARSPSLPVASTAALGACLLLLADLVAQSLPLHATLPIGRMTGIVGGIYLIWLLARPRQA